MDLPGVKYSLWGYGKGLSNDPEHIKTGCNSGYAALNLAYLKGSQEIHLIGYDMNPADNDQYQFWAPLFLDTVEQFKVRGTKVLNHNPSSSIDAFPRVPLKS